MSKATGDVTVELELFDRASKEKIWSQTLHSEISRYYMLYTSSAMVYGRAGAFSLNVLPPPGDAGVNVRSLFSWHFAALREAMLEARPGIAAAMQGR
jgi:hypothetical protein